MERRLKKTALYHVFTSVRNEGILGKQLIDYLSTHTLIIDLDVDRTVMLRPGDLYFAVAQDELSQRFTGASSESLAQLWDEYHAENSQLETVLVSGEFEQIYREVARLAQMEDVVDAVLEGRYDALFGSNKATVQLMKGSEASEPTMEENEEPEVVYIDGDSGAEQSNADMHVDPSDMVVIDSTDVLTSDENVIELSDDTSPPDHTTDDDMSDVEETLLLSSS
jgi:hypothetical protein